MSPLARKLRPLEPLALSVLALLAALLVSGLGIAAFGRSPFAAAQALAAGSLGDLAALGETSLKATAFTFTGLAVALPLAAGFFNIGGQGQFLCGAVATAWAGQALDLPPLLELPAALACGALAGGLYALIPAALKVYRGVHEVISSILLNWVAIYLINDWLVVGPLAESRGDSHFASGGTAPVIAAAHLPLFVGEQSRLNLGWPLALLFAVLAYVFLRRSALGLEVRALGSSRESARALGLPVARRALLAMGLGGAMAGLGGACMILGGGTDYRYPENYRDSYGFDGIAVALLGAAHPLGVCVSAFFFGALRAGAVRLQDPEIGLHRVWPEIAQALAVIAVATKPALRGLWRRGVGVLGGGERG